MHVKVPEDFSSSEILEMLVSFKHPCEGFSSSEILEMLVSFKHPHEGPQKLTKEARCLFKEAQYMRLCIAR